MKKPRSLTIRIAPVIDNNVAKYQEEKGITTWTGALFALVDAGLKAELKEKAQST